ncbi:Fe-S cluster assembly protein SufD [Prolixibacteraceae bacterium JC049]|nr:Fe-S cluster assembly protein SufD [Prolixibacteraceae bacterium JC049]
MTVNTAKYTATQDLVDLYNGNLAMWEKDSPEWMNAARKEAVEHFQKLGIPSSRNENYKYTDLRKWFQADYNVYPTYVERDMEMRELFKCNVPEMDTALVLTANGWYSHKNKAIALPEGVIMGSLAEIAQSNPEVISEYYNQLADNTNDPLAALNTMLAKDGIVFYVPNNVVVEQPIQIINMLQSHEDAFATQRNLFIIGRNAEAKIIFCDHTMSGHRFLANNLTEIFVGENATFDFYNLQNQHNESGNLTSTYVKQAASSTFNSNVATLHGGLVRNNLIVRLAGEGAEANLSGMSLADGKQHIDNFLSINHEVGRCNSNQLYKNVLDDRSSGAFTGKIHVQRDAQQTNAFQRNANVLASEKAKMNTKPQLVIDANDVKCSHGATVGRIDEDALFYLKSRGINDKEARLMLMLAFTHEVIQNIRVESLRDRLDDLVEKRFRGEISKCHNCAYRCG